jgi:integrase
MERVTDNPVSRVAKPRQPGGREVPPVPPVTVEQLRAQLGPADALMVSVLAYAGLRPQELLALQWNDIHERAILVRRKNVDGQLYPYTKTRQNRRVKLLAPLATDLAGWKLATGRRGHDLVVPNARGEPWTRHQYQHWRRHVYNRTPPGSG